MSQSDNISLECFDSVLRENVTTIKENHYQSRDYFPSTPVAFLDVLPDCAVALWASCQLRY